MPTLLRVRESLMPNSVLARPTQSSARPVPRAYGPAGRIRLAALQVPLAAKLIGANGLVVLAMVATCMWVGGVMSAAVAVVGAAGLVLHLMLIYLALRPIRDLESVASQVWQGDFAARVTRSSV